MLDKPEILSLLTERGSALERAARTIRQGGLVVFPTDTVYGIGADAFQPFATSIIFTVKGRSRTLPIPVMVHQPRQAWALATHVPKEAAELAAHFWPGPLTLVLKQAEGLAWNLGDARGTVALRIPDSADARELIAEVGPLAVTSANRTGEPTPGNVAEISGHFGTMVSLYLDGGASKSDIPSTIVDLSHGRPRLKREGAIPRAELERVLGSRILGS